MTFPDVDVLAELADEDRIGRLVAAVGGVQPVRLE